MTKSLFPATHSPFLASHRPMPHEKRFGSVSIAGVATLLSMSEILGVLDEDLIRSALGRFEDDKHPPFGQFAHARTNSDLKVHMTSHRE